MALLPFVVLHGAAGMEMTGPEYLYRVLRYLVAVGGTAAVASWVLNVVDARRPEDAADRDGGEADA